MIDLLKSFWADGSIGLIAIALLFATLVMWAVDREAVNACKQTPACLTKITPMYEGAPRD